MLRILNSPTDIYTHIKDREIVLNPHAPKKARVFKLERNNAQ